MLGYEEEEVGESSGRMAEQDPSPMTRDRVRLEIKAHLEGKSPHFQE